MILALVLVFLLCDAALWVFAPIPFQQAFLYQPDGHIRARLAPNQVVDNANGCKVHINRYGFRGPDYTLEKPPGVLRLEVFGGSAAFDFFTSSEEKSWCGALQKKLHQRLAMPVEVINLGVAGYDSYTSKTNYLYNGRIFHPDAALFYHGWNCMGQFRKLAKHPYQGGVRIAGHSLVERIGRLSQLGRHLYPIYRARIQHRSDDILSGVDDTGADFDKPVDPKALQWLRQNYVDFVNFTQADGVCPIVATMGNLLSRENYNDPKIHFGMAEACVQRGFTYPRTLDNLDLIAQMIQSLAEERKVIFVDAYNAIPHDFVHFRDTVHFTDAGSEALAETFANTLLKDERFLAVVKKVKAETAATSLSASAHTNGSFASIPLAAPPAP